MRPRTRLLLATRFPVVVGSLLIVGLVSLPIGAQEASVHIQLRPQVEVGSPRVTLGDIAILNTPDSQLLSKLKTLPLGWAPRFCESVALGRDSLEPWIRSRTGIEAGRIRWAGPLVSTVRSAAGVVEGGQIARCAQASLQAGFKASSLRAEINLERTPQDIRVPAGRVELKARTQAAFQQAAVGGEAGLKTPANPLFSKRQSVWVDIWVDGRFIRVVPVDFEVSVYAPAYVATEDLSAGEVLDPHKLSVREVEWTGRNPLPMPVKSKPIGTLGDGDPLLELRRPVSAGETLSQTQVEPAPLVTRGAYAMLNSVQGPIVVESRVEVLQDGLLGQLVKVKLPNASNAIQARVVGLGLVEVRQ